MHMWWYEHYRMSIVNTWCYTFEWNTDICHLTKEIVPATVRLRFRRALLGTRRLHLLRLSSFCRIHWVPRVPLSIGELLSWPASLWRVWRTSGPTSWSWFWWLASCTRTRHLSPAWRSLSDLYRRVSSFSWNLVPEHVTCLQLDVACRICTEGFRRFPEMKYFIVSNLL